MPSSYFNEQMSYSEAQRTFFILASGKSGKELEQIKSEYLKVLPIITKHELICDDGRMTSCSLS